MKTHRFSDAKAFSTAGSIVVLPSLGGCKHKRAVLSTIYYLSFFLLGVAMTGRLFLLYNSWSKDYKAYIRRRGIMSTVINHETNAREYSATSVGELIQLANHFAPNETLDSIVPDSIRSFLRERKSTVSSGHRTSTGWLSYLTPKRPTRLLCTTFMSANENAFQSLFGKMRNMDGECDWAILIFGGDMAQARSFEGRFLNTAPLKRSRIILFEYGMSRDLNLLRYGVLPRGVTYNEVREYLNEEKYNFKIFPKTLLMLSLIPHLPKYDRVWLFDEDISFNGFHIKNFLRNLECAFDNPPLVAQPLIYENTQSYDFLNYKSWEGRGTSIIASSSGFIEIQTPFLDAGYFEWYLKNIVARMILPSFILGADWGFDALFCKTAEVYAEEMGKLDQEALLNTPTHTSRARAAVSDAIASVRPALLRVVGFSPASGLDPGTGSPIDALQQPDSPRYGHTITAGSTAAGTVAVGKTGSVGDFGATCAIIIDGTPISHLNSKSIDSSLGPKIKKALNQEMIRILQQSFPQYVAMGNVDENNPLQSPAKFTFSHNLVKDCSRRGEQNNAKGKVRAT